MADTGKMTKEQFLEHMQVYFGEGVCFKTMDAQLGTIVATVDEEGLVTLLPKTALLSFVAQEHASSIVEWHLYEIGATISLCAWYPRAAHAPDPITPIHWIFANDDEPHPYHMDSQHCLAKLAAQARQQILAPRRDTAGDVVQYIWHTVKGLRGKIPRLTIDAANYILDVWLPKRITVTPRDIRRKCSKLLAEMARLDEFATLLEDE